MIEKTVEFDTSKIGEFRKTLADHVSQIIFETFVKVGNVEVLRDEASVRISVALPQDKMVEALDHALTEFHDRQFETRVGSVKRTDTGFNVTGYFKIKQTAKQERDALTEIAAIKNLSMDERDGYRLVGYVPGDRKPYVIRRLADNANVPAGKEFVERTFRRET